MFNKQLKKNIKMIDDRINDLMVQLADVESGDDTTEIMAVIDKLTETRNKLSGNKVSESLSKEVVAGVISMAGILLVLKHEKADIITTKAFNMIKKVN